MKTNVLARLTERRARRHKWRQTFAALLQSAVVEAHQFEITRPLIKLSKLPRAFDGGEHGDRARFRLCDHRPLQRVARHARVRGQQEAEQRP